MIEYIYFCGSLLALAGVGLLATGTIAVARWIRKAILCGIVLLSVCVIALYAISREPSPEIQSFIKILAATEVPMVLYDENVQVVYANEGALKFYNIDLESIRGKEPQQLHAWAQPYMLNFKDWAAEQVNRNTAARNGTLHSKSTVPMHMGPTHIFGDKYWYLSSQPLFVDHRRYLLTTFIAKDRPE